MKASITKILIFIILIWVSLLYVTSSYSVKIIPEENIQQLKQGKTFWQWSKGSSTLDVHYVEAGKGDNHIVLLHGFRAHTYTWNEIIHKLADAGMHVWAVDLIGFGLSDKPSEISYDQTLFTDQIRSFMKAKAIDKAHLVGNSMGGTVALNVTLQEPELVASITLINALGYELKMPFYIYIFNWS